jgi:hypothetical protein
VLDNKCPFSSKLPSILILRLFEKKNTGLRGATLAAYKWPISN